jgi:hypothetical protein
MSKAEMTSNESWVRGNFPTTKYYEGADGCHVEIDGAWVAFGNIPENAWKNARHILEDSKRKLAVHD